MVVPPPPLPTDPYLLNFHQDHISNHIKFKLNLSENNYITWLTFFTFVLQQHRILDHVQHPPPADPDASWLTVDHRLTLWILFTLADNLLELIMGGAKDAFTAWSRTRDYFQANQGARYLHQTRQFLNLKQGDLTVSEYARKLKALMDSLTDMGNPIIDHDLMMQLLHGLDARLDTIQTILGHMVPLPPFDVTRSRLDLAEFNINLRVAQAGSAALTITGYSSS